ncbi:MAG TPA: ABC transporter permease [Candidatus Binataceae bacterium]|jgi:ABC-2 type transport system permease protein|nr:ABC transporter permease [Candidatus Binataceae bacterium]
MRWKRTWAIARKEIIQVLRDWRSLVIIAAMPIVMTLLYGYGVSFDIKHVPMCVYDREGSQQSQDLLKRFQASEYFRIVGNFTSYAPVVREIDSGRCRLAIIVPSQFSRLIAEGGTVKVQALVDASDDNTANVAMGYSGAVLSRYSQRVQADWMARNGITRVDPPLSLDARTWFNEDLESRAFILPGVIAIVMAVIGTFLTALTIAREWERGTMEQLVSTPVTPLELVAGKLLPYFVIGMVATAMCAAVSIFWFRIPFRGHLSTLFGTSALFLFVVLALGFWISVRARSQLVASQAAMVATFMPAFLLSGFIFPIDQMPAPIRVISYLVPASYYDTILKGVFLKGITSAALRFDILFLAGFALLIGTVAVLSFRKRLD